MADATPPKPGIIIGNSLKDSPMDPLVPKYMEDTSDLVQKYLSQSATYAAASVLTAQTTIAALAAGTGPLSLPTVPPVETVSVSGDVTATFAQNTPPVLGDVLPSDPGAFTPATITVTDVSSKIPDYTALITGISIPLPPTGTVVTMPTVPAIDSEFELPTAPISDYGSSPVLGEFTIPVYVPSIIPLFGESVPTFDVLPPNPAIQWSEPVYSSSIQDQVKIVLGEMLAGGTGLPADVENAIWHRGREREDSAAEQQVRATMEQWTTRGFSHPPGQLNSQIIVLRDMAGRKVNELSREVMVKQADLEQTNRNFAVTGGIDYERVFTAVFLQVVDRNFQIAKFAVETQIQVYNLQVTAFNVEQQVYAQQILLYRSQLEAMLAEIRVFEAQVSAVKAGVELDVAKVQAFGEKVRAFTAEVNAYSEEIKAEIAKADLEKTKVELYKAQIEGVVAQLQADREKYLSYNTKIQGEIAKVQLEETHVRTYAERVRAIGIESEIVIKNGEFRLAADKQALEWNIANMQRITTLNGQQLSMVQSKVAQYQTANARSIAKYDADLKGKQAELQADIDLSRLQIARYQIVSDQWRAAAQQIIQVSEVNAQSLRSAGQIAGTLAAGAMAATHVQASLSSQTQASQTSSRQASDHTGHSESYANNYTTQHSYTHKT